MKPGFHAYWTGSWHGIGLIWKSDFGPGVQIGAWFVYFGFPAKGPW